MVNNKHNIHNHVMLTRSMLITVIPVGVARLFLFVFVLV